MIKYTLDTGYVIQLGDEKYVVLGISEYFEAYVKDDCVLMDNFLQNIKKSVIDTILPSTQYYLYNYMVSKNMREFVYRIIAPNCVLCPLENYPFDIKTIDFSELSYKEHTLEILKKLDKEEVKFNIVKNKLTREIQVASFEDIYVKYFKQRYGNLKITSKAREFVEQYFINQMNQCISDYDIERDGTLVKLETENKNYFAFVSTDRIYDQICLGAYCPIRASLVDKIYVYCQNFQGMISLNMDGYKITKLNKIKRKR